jgi:hypothetical protein
MVLITVPVASDRLFDLLAKVIIHMLNVFSSEFRNLKDAVKITKYSGLKTSTSRGLTGCCLEMEILEAKEDVTQDEAAGQLCNRAKNHFTFYEYINYKFYQHIN